jgi:hypothetical protein
MKQFLTKEPKNLIVTKSKYSQLSILGLAYECGFNFKTTFNAFFKGRWGGYIGVLQEKLKIFLSFDNACNL